MDMMEDDGRALAPVPTSSTGAIQLHVTRMKLLDRCATIGEKRPKSRLLLRNTDGTLKLSRPEGRRRDHTQSFQNWLSRSQSSVKSAPGGLAAPSGHSLSPASGGGSSRSLISEQLQRAARTGSVNRAGQQGTGLSTVRQTKTSLLRFKSCPESYANRDVAVLASKRKSLEKRCRNISASAIVCSNLPEGETVHSFLTGARYNTAHVIDSRSLRRVGVYIPRRDVSGVFVNPAGIAPPSPAVYGHRGNQYSKPGLSPTPLGGCYYNQSANVLTNSTAEGSISSIDREIDQVFGLDQGGTDSSSSDISRVVQNEGMSRHAEASSEEPLESLPSGNNLAKSQQGTASIKERQSSIALPLMCERDSQGETISTLKLSKVFFPPGLEALTDVPLGGSVSREESSADTRQAGLQSALAWAPEQPLDLLSPEAQRITDQILNEAELLSITGSGEAHDSTDSVFLVPECEPTSPDVTTSPHSTFITANKSLQTSFPWFGEDVDQSSTQSSSSPPRPASGPKTDRSEGSEDRLRPPSSSRHPRPAGDRCPPSASADADSDALLGDERSSSIFIDLQSQLQPQECNGESES